MLLFLIALGIGLGIRALRPGCLKARLSVRYVGLPVVAVLLQAGLGVGPMRHFGGDGRFFVIVLSYVVIGIWLIVNSVSQMPPLRAAVSSITLGWLANTIAIVANHGMPVSLWALSEIGKRHDQVASGNLFKHIIAGQHVVVSFLGDVIPVAVPVVRNVISIGDVLVFIGVIIGLSRIDWRSTKSAVPDSRGVIHNEVVLQVPHSP